MKSRIVIACLAFAACAQAQKIPNVFGGKKTGGSTPVDSMKSREFYEQMKDFSEGLYKQPDREDFRLIVDREYEDLLRKHGKRAFEMNTSAKTEVMVVNEDRFRVFSGLYDNLAIQDLVNRIGQEVTPKSSDKLFAFKLVADPIPRAESLATGTVYVTTGLVALLDNKAQLAYVLAHEAAHVSKEHWKRRVMVEVAKKEYEKRSEENRQRMQTWGTLVGIGVGASLGGAIGQTSQSAVFGGAAGALAGYAAGSMASRGEVANMDWNAPEEDEADEIALKSVLEANIAVQEVPKLYLALDKSSMKDDRVGMGFWGNRLRMRERLTKVQESIDGPLKETIAGKALTGDGKEFRKLIAELKRDNGVLAFEYDMLEVARDNLEQAVEARGDDATALYFYGKVLRLLSKTDEDRARANDMFLRAIKADHRNYAYGAYLHSAVPYVDTKNKAEADQAVSYLKLYVINYIKAQQDAAAFNRSNTAPHIESIYDYMSRLGNTDYNFGVVLAGKETPAQDKFAPVVPPPAPVVPGAKPVVVPVRGQGTKPPQPAVK
jgi:hypothetical protein